MDFFVDLREAGITFGIQKYSISTDSHNAIDEDNAYLFQLKNMERKQVADPYEI